MFEVDNKYSIHVQDLINEIENKQLGLQVIKVKDWALPINRYKIELEVSKAKNLNIIEEFIIKIALSNIEDIVTEEIIQSMLRLDGVFTSKYINRLADVGVIDKKMLPRICITELGKQQFDKGQVLTKDKKVTITAFIQPKFNLFYSKVQDQNSTYPLLNIECTEVLSATAIENDRSLMENIIEIAKEDKLIISRESVNQFVSKVNSVIPMGDPVGLNFIEFWIYDIIEDKLYCRVWDCQQARYNNGISEYIAVTKPLTKDDFETSHQLHESKETVTNKYEDLYKEEVKIQRNEGTSSKLSLRMIRGSEIKTEFNKYLKAAKKYLYIQSPWISKNVVDDDMIRLFENLANKNCKIFISWGIARDISKEDRKPEQELIERLRSIKGKDDLPKVSIYWIGNHHNKEIIVDNNSHLAGSFNWLSYRGDYLPRGESVYITNDKLAIKDAKMYWEEQIFNKVSKEIWKEDYIREINALINLETLDANVKELIMGEISKLFNEQENDNIVKLYNIALVYFKNQLFDEVFVEIITYLVDRNEFLKQSFIMLNYLKKHNNAQIYNSIMEKYKDKFIQANIINDKSKPDKSLTKKKIVEDLKFK